MFKKTFDLRLLIQVATILFAVIMAYASIDGHVKDEDVHQGYEELSRKFIPREIFEREIVYVKEKLDKIEKLIVNRRTHEFD